MCGIIGGEVDVNKGIKLIENRGKDFLSKRKICIGKKDFYFYHLLHAIVNFVKQPLENERYLFLANCEIYNWKNIAKKYKINSRNDAELLFNLIIKLSDGNLIKGLKKIDKEVIGSYSLAILDKKKGEIYLARDLIGVRPLFYSTTPFLFASERKVVNLFSTSFELHPRKILRYDGKVKLYNKKFVLPKVKEIDEEKAVRKLKEMLKEMIKMQVPKVKYGLLLGGIDSLIIAKILKELNEDFTCYVAGIEKSKDVKEVRKVAKKYGLKVKVVKISKEEIEKEIGKICKIIESIDPIKVEVAIPIYFACKEAKKDRCKVLFSGTGSDELFNGYKKNSFGNLQMESYYNLTQMYERNCYRDDTITMTNNIEIRSPFLENLKLINFSLSLPNKLKVNNDVKKFILRKVALLLGIDKDDAFRKKVAIQYGSGVNKLLKKMRKKEEYLKKISNVKEKRVACLISSGKDSLFALYNMYKRGYKIEGVISIESENAESYFFHTPLINFTKIQAKLLNLPIIYEKSKGKKEEELKDLEKAIKKAIAKWKIEGIVAGAIASNYQRDRLLKITEKLGIALYCPLWHEDQESILKGLIKSKFKFTLTSISALGIPKKFIGKVLTANDIKELIELSRKYKFNPCGEGGEYESLTLYMPLFSKEIVLDDFEVIKESEYNYKIKIKKWSLKEI